MNDSDHLTLSRRQWLRGLTASAGCLLLDRPAPAKFPAPLSFQVHAIRESLMRDFDGTLRVLRGVGYRGVEMASFPGFRGSPRGDFGMLADLPASELAQRIRAAGLDCVGCHFLISQFQTADGSEQAIEWAVELGSPRIMLTAFQDALTLTAIQTLCEQVAGASEIARKAGRRLVVHTDQALWGAVQGQPAIDRMLSLLSPAICGFELDFGGVIAFGIDAPKQLRSHLDRFECMHIRDGLRPPEPSEYVPARVPGDGVLDWSAILAAARTSGVQQYVVEMETKTPQALADCVRAYRILQSHWS